MAFEANRSRRDSAIAAVVLLLALVLLLLPDAYQEGIRGVVRATVLRPFLAAAGEVARQRTQRVSLQEVRAERDSLIAVATSQRVLAEENQRLRAMLRLAERAGGAFLPAEVIGLSEPGAEHTFFLTAGREAGVREGSAVLSPSGLFGVVRLVSDGYAQGIDWGHPEFRVSAMTDDGSAYGMVEPRPGSFREEDMLAFVGAPFHSDVPAGTRVVTSGRGGIFPRGIPVGTVVGIEEADTGWRKSYLLRPAARPASVLHVLVSTGGSTADFSEVWDVTAPADTAEVAAAAEQGG